MIVEVTHFSSSEKYVPEGITLFEDEEIDRAPQVWTEEWFIVGEFYFQCAKQHPGDENTQLNQHDSRAQEWVTNMSNVRTVRYQYEGPELPWYKHERNIANLIFQDMYPDGHKLKGEPVGTLTKL